MILSLLLLSINLMCPCDLKHYYYFLNTDLKLQHVLYGKDVNLVVYYNLSYSFSQVILS